LVLSASSDTARRRRQEILGIHVYASIYTCKLGKSMSMGKSAPADEVKCCCIAGCSGCCTQTSIDDCGLAWKKYRLKNNNKKYSCQVLPDVQREINEESGRQTRTLTAYISFYTTRWLVLEFICDPIYV
jgi:hypothetical protein